MAGLIQKWSSTITDFMNMYLNNPRRLHTSELQALWDVSFITLEEGSRTFLGIVSFSVSDNIPQDLFDFTDEEELEFSPDLEFCSVDFG